MLGFTDVLFNTDFFSVCLCVLQSVECSLWRVRVIAIQVLQVRVCCGHLTFEATPPEQNSVQAIRCVV